MKLPTSACPGCTAETSLVEDVDTHERIRIDVDRVDDGHIVVWSIKGNAFARRYGKPARIQPAWREHECPAGVPAVTGRADDPYADLTPAAQQHGGWRA